MRNKSFCLVLVFAVGLLVNMPSHLFAEGGVAIVDIQKALEQSIMGKAIQNTIREESKKIQLELSVKQKTLAEFEKEVEKQKSLLSQDAMSSKVAELTNRQREFKRAYEDGLEKLNAERSKQIAKAVEKIDNIAKEISDKKGLEFILEKDPRFVLYYSEKLDITEDVIKALDEQTLNL